MKKFGFALKNVSKKSYLGALLFAMALWLYASLGSSFSTLVNMPLIIQLPEDRAFEAAPPATVAIEAKGTGWNLFNLLYFNKSKKIFLDLSKTQINDSLFNINRSSLLKGLQSFERVELSDILTENVSIITGKVTTYSVAIEPDITIIPADGFYLVGKPKLEPDMIEIRGNDKVVSNIKTWKTKPLVLEDRNRAFQYNLELSDTLSEIVKLSRTNINFTADIQQTAEVTFDEIRISIRGGSIPKNHKLQPEFVSITFRGGINEIIDLNPDKISVTLNYADILNDKSGILVPKIEFPGSSRVINLMPRFIYNYKIIETDNLTKIVL
jgi:YbbR domain-containing protein